MLGFGRPRFRCPDGGKVSDDAHVSDYASGARYGRVTLGSLGFYYRDLGKKYCVPYGYIDRAFKRISECAPDDSPAIWYFRLILVHEGREFANLIFEDEKPVDAILASLPEKNPSIAIGYVPPADGRRKASFC